METPPYSIDEFKNKKGNGKGKLGSLNENLPGMVLVTDSMKKSQTGSINDDQDDEIS
jgi:hypothetical protein